MEYERSSFVRMCSRFQGESCKASWVPYGAPDNNNRRQFVAALEERLASF